MKKRFSVLLAAVLLVLTAFPAAAEGSEIPDWQHVDNDLYFFGYVLDDSAEETTFSNLYYYSENITQTYIPNTFIGVTLTPEILNGTNLFDCAAPFCIDEDNANYSVHEGALYTKDGETLLSVPLSFIFGRHDSNAFMRTEELTGLYAIPDGTKTVGACAVRAEDDTCVVFPDSVTQIDPYCGVRPGAAIAASPGTAAEKYAQERGVAFIPLGEAHTQMYFRTVDEPNCTEGGRVTIQCPCGKVAAVELSDPQPDAHWYLAYRDPQTGTYLHRCEICGATAEKGRGGEECTCDCHAVPRNFFPTFQNGFVTMVRSILYRVRLLWWRITGTHQYCECGARHY